MTTNSEAKTNAQSTNYLLKVVVILLVVIIVIIGSIFAISAYWASYQQQQAQKMINGLFPTSSPPTPTPSTWTIILNTGEYFNHTPQDERMDLLSNSPTDITFTANNILYNGQSADSYGSFAPQLSSFNLRTNSNGQYIIRNGYENTIDIYFPEGPGSPWVSGVSVQMSIITSNAQGSTTFTVP